MRSLLRSPLFARFICAQMWGRRVLPTALPAPLSATLSPALSVYLCRNVGPQGLLVLGLPAPFVPHSASLGPATATRVLSTLVPVSAPPTGLDECLFFISLVSDPLAVRFSVSSGCARRRSVSTYAAILVVPKHIVLKVSLASLGLTYNGHFPFTYFSLGLNLLPCTFSVQIVIICFILLSKF